VTPGEEATFVAFVQANSATLLKAAWFISGDAGSAEELVQAALEKVYLAWHRVDPGKAVAYARRTMLHQHIDTRRRRVRERLTDTPPERPAYEVSEDTAFLVRVLGELSERERQVVVLRYYVDLPESEVADLLDVSVGTVKSTASRGLAHLRARLALEGEPHVR
jgi:RNA polymerase sigma-70 factor (sigma-E family)